MSRLMAAYRKHGPMPFVLGVALCLWAAAFSTNALIDLGAVTHDLFCPEHGTLF